MVKGYRYERGFWQVDGWEIRVKRETIETN